MASGTYTISETVRHEPLSDMEWNPLGGVVTVAYEHLSFDRGGGSLRRGVRVPHVHVLNPRKRSGGPDGYEPLKGPAKTDCSNCSKELDGLLMNPPPFRPTVCRKWLIGRAVSCPGLPHTAKVLSPGRLDLIALPHAFGHGARHPSRLDVVQGTALGRIPSVGRLFRHAREKWRVGR